jgi:hypothetical protein
MGSTVPVVLLYVPGGVGRQEAAAAERSMIYDVIYIKLTCYKCYAAAQIM